MNKLFGMIAAGLAVVAVADDAAANPGGAGGAFRGANVSGPRLPFFRQTPVPAFQAAPWYLYWPYNGHFMTPAPLQGAFYAPPGGGYGGGMQNPYFPAYPAAVPATVMPAVTPAVTPAPAAGTAMPAVLPIR